MKNLFWGLSLALTTLPLTLGSAQASVLQPTGITTKVLSGSNDPSNPFTDDLLLDSLTFSGASFNSSDSFRAISRLEVLSGRGAINAEWGDNDTGTDGDDNPFTKAGYDPADQETTDATIQDATLLETFNTLSLTEISDGEGNQDFSFRVEFSASLQDNDDGADDVPEIVFFERGLNDVFSVTLITGGTFEAPTFSDTVSVNSRHFWDTGIDINTTEISGAQSVGVGGFDLSTFGIAAGASVYGFQIDVLRGSGPDLNGFFLSAEDGGSFQPPLTAVPLPAALPLLVAALGSFAALRSRRTRK